MRATSVLALALVGGFAVGCGGGSEAAAVDPGTGTELRTAGGEAVLQEAHDKWQEGLEAFGRYEGEGWNSDRCGQVDDLFEEANDVQGGDFSEAIYMRGLVAKRCGDDDEARSFFEAALAASDQGKFCKARTAIGVMELDAGNTQVAYNTFRRALSDDSRCTEAYVNLAFIQRQRGGEETREALNNLRRALAIDATYLPAFNQMALLYLDQGVAQENEQMLDLAAVVCRQAQLIDANYADIYNTWGLISVEKDNIIEAIRFFEKAIELDSDMFAAYMNFGSINQSFRGYDAAKNAFSRAVELQPNSYEAHIGLGAAYRGLGNVDQAEQEYERAKELEPNRPEAYFNLGILYQDYKSGSVEDLQKAKQFYQQFLAKAGNDAKYRETVENVRRTCDQNQNRRRRRRRSDDCRPGRLQNIDTAVEALQAAAEMQRQMEQRQQQQQQGGGE